MSQRVKLSSSMMSLTLNCYYPAEDPCFFAVELGEKDRVNILVKKVQELLKEYGLNIKLSELQLFKADVPIEPEDDLRSRVLQWLHRGKGAGLLKATNRLSPLFPAGSSASDMIYIIVSDSAVSEMSEGLSDPRRKKLRKDLSERIDSLCPTFSPSDTISSIPKTRELVEGVNAHVYLGRPGGAPAAIFNPALAALQRRLDHLDQIQVTRQDVTHATDYLNLAIKIYDDEAARESAVEESINTAVGRDGSWNTKLDWAGGIKPSCCWWNKEFIITLLELKNVVGLDGNPILQAIFDYGKIISQKKYKHFLEYCNFPTVLVGIAENRIDISIAVWVGEIHVTNLLTLDVISGFLASDNIVRLARVFNALSSCQKDIALYYDEVGQKTAPPLASLFPIPTPMDPSVISPILTYKKFLTRTGQPTSTLVGLGDNKVNAMYVAAMDGTDNDVIVKFTARYHKKAHRILAGAGFAPKLYFCERVVGGLCMVVMDRVDGKSLRQLQVEKKLIPTIVSKHMRQAVHLLHEQNIVFGDLRDPNILYDASSGCTFVVDFDWPGIHEVDRYPATLNPNNSWPEDVMAYGLMLKAHDLWQLKRLDILCQPSA